MEYGGPFSSSRIPDLSTNSTGYPHLHFLKVELDVHFAVKALCEGVEMPLAAEMSMVSQCLTMHSFTTSYHVFR